MKIIHCADMHLDSPMQTHLSPEKARQRNAEITQTFLELIAYARKERVTAVLITGDLFDENRVSRQTLDMVLFAMEQAQETDFLYLPGNHDARVLSSLPLPKNLKLFSHTWQCHSYGEIRIWGLELTKENAHCLYDTLNCPTNGFNIVALHGQAATASGEGLIHLGRLKQKNIDYLALGHLHTHRLERLDARGIWGYCGCLEGRGFDETGEKGFVLLDTGSAGVDIRFVPFARRTLHAPEVDITGMRSNSQVYAAIETQTAHIPEQDLVQINLTGKKDPQAEISSDYLRQLLEGRFFALEFKNRWQLAVEEFQPDISLRGEYIRLVLEQELPDDQKDLLLRMGLQALSGEELSV